MVLRIRLLPVLLIIAVVVFVSGLAGAAQILVGLIDHSGETCVSVGNQSHCGTAFEVQVGPDGKMVVLHSGDRGYYSGSTAR